MINKILNQIRQHAIDCPDAIAIRYKDEEITFQEFEQETNYIALNLKKHISQRNEPIVIYQQRGIRFVEYMIGVMKSGCYYIPIENDIPFQRVQYIVADVGARIVLSDHSNILSMT